MSPTTAVRHTEVPRLKEKRIGMRSIAHLSLISTPTPLQTLDAYSTKLDMALPILIKREDLSSSRYGGNKVRNLEFVLADALVRGSQCVKTLVPYGSNFTAALASEAASVGLGVNLHQFVARENAQTHAHANFAALHRAKLHTHPGRLGPARALMSYIADRSSYSISPGASNVLGAAGHMHAFLETLSQLESHGRKAPDFVVVGTGTCGTTAGILAGIRSSGVRTRVMGVRCADPIVCNPHRILRLSNQLLAFGGLDVRVRRRDFELVAAPGHLGYGHPSTAAMAAAQDFFDLEGLSLDVTYTSKVIAALTALRQKRVITPHHSVLYWHTYSARAHHLYL